MRVPWRRLAQLALIAALLAACPPARAAHNPARGNADWPRIGNTTDQHHYSTLDQITTANVGRLRLAWSLREGSHLTLFEDTPVVVAGIIYLTTNTDQVIAARADTGRRLWIFTPAVDFLHQLMSGDVAQPVNRGVAVANGHVYLATYDDQLISLSAATGKQEWRVVTANPDRYYEQSPPTYWNGLLFLGEAGIGPGVRGFVSAFDARTGRLRWRIHTVPAPGHDWMAGNGQTGGGDVWMPVTVDPRTGIVYAGTGNPTPALVNRARPGCDQWTDATLALDGRTGRLLWGRSQECRDVWDYDSAQSPMLLPVNWRGKPIPAVGEGSKAGRYWIFNAKTGATLAISPPLGTQTVPRPIPSPLGVRVCPGIYGSLEYSPPAYSPRTGLIYLPGLNLCTVDRSVGASSRGQSPSVAAFGGTAAVAPGQPSGFLAALDPSTGHLRWQVKVPRPMIGGALATAGNLVFSGADDGRFYAFDARNGAILWRPSLGLGVGGAPITYMVNGVQYVAIAAGGSAVAPETGARLGGRLLVFRLG